ncbi:hypothetical protein pEaSNUABM19_00442 [Erwinia phage pEa_SNUABM_19]|uniref:Uncharacterized protein n=1 Tax=Erwinia phage pEa_SNUABM_12 TaxID=2768773 RepID=A0A7L8ZN72_9CAUD|nr:hypothetical protein pEaSNUABM12_00442 [Erwinia phage pEa_SNUABM_12]QXO11579.1 hypothetical protein pEaSNUABM19_00442 [Erwinia phage pEa_SNUABM_19]
MKLVAIERFGDFSMPYLKLFKGSEDSPSPEVVLAELEAVNYQINVFSDQDEKLDKQMTRILNRNGYTEFEPPTVTISD